MKTHAINNPWWVAAGINFALLIVLLILIAGLGTGCSFSNPKFLERVTATNGVVTEKSLRVSQWALWPATQSVSRQKASLGRTFSFGSEGLEQESTGTNSIEFVERASRGFGEGLGRAVKGGL
jgi:hypothetical protein